MEGRRNSLAPKGQKEGWYERDAEWKTQPYLADRQGDGQRARVQFACERAHGPKTRAPRQSDEQNGGRLGGAPRGGHCGGGEGARGS
jgi:hypothetical protein